jgi:flagellar basal body-associated protein FliL
MNGIKNLQILTKIKIIILIIIIIIIIIIIMIIIMLMNLKQPIYHKNINGTINHYKIISFNIIITIQTALI